MKMTFHGGNCCGIKHISGMGEGPDKLCFGKNETEPRTEYIEGEEVSSEWDVFSESRPVESGEDRLKAMLNYLSQWRSKGIVEITLVLMESDSNFSQRAWVPVLEKLGFREVNSCFNSNSGNIVHVYHLNME